MTDPKHPMAGTPMEVATHCHDEQAAMLMAALGDYEQKFHDEWGEDGWDAPLWLMMIYRSLPPTELADMMQQAGIHGEFVGIKPVQDLTEMGVNSDGGPPLYYFLQMFADSLKKSEAVGMEAMRSDLANGAPDFLAWALHFEGYEIAGLKPGEEPPRGPFKNDPRSVECRMVMAVDRAGFRYSVRRIRPTNEVGAAIDMNVDVDEGPRLGGRVLDGLQALMAVTPAEIA